MRVIYLGGPWDGLEVERRGNHRLGALHRLPFSQSWAAVLAGMPLPKRPRKSLLVAVYRMDKSISRDGNLRCRYVEAKPLGDH